MKIMAEETAAYNLSQRGTHNVTVVIDDYFSKVSLARVLKTLPRPVEIEEPATLKAPAPRPPPGSNHYGSKKRKGK
jgi:hypothetical protein